MTYEDAYHKMVKENEKLRVENKMLKQSGLQEIIATANALKVAAKEYEELDKKDKELSLEFVRGEAYVWWKTKVNPLEMELRRLTNKLIKSL